MLNAFVTKLHKEKKRYKCAHVLSIGLWNMSVCIVRSGSIAISEFTHV